jgi:hypothetical protein
MLCETHNKQGFVCYLCKRPFTLLCSVVDSDKFCSLFHGKLSFRMPLQ